MGLKFPIKRIHLPILTYHQIGEDLGSGLSVSVKTFVGQMQFLKDKGYHSITLEEAAGLLKSEKPLPPRSVVITFDDGFKNIYTLAYSILEKYGFTATIFLVADFLGKDNDWSENKEKLSSPLLGPEEIASMPSISYGSHALNHRHLTRLSESEAREEIGSSRKKLQDLIGREILTFCYPYGDYNASIARIVQEAGYSCACTTRRGNRHRPDKLFVLKRIPITEITLNRFQYRLTSLYDWEHRE